MVRVDRVGRRVPGHGAANGEVDLLRVHVVAQLLGELIQPVDETELHGGTIGEHCAEFEAADHVVVLLHRAVARQHQQTRASLPPADIIVGGGEDELVVDVALAAALSLHRGAVDGLGRGGGRQDRQRDGRGQHHVDV